MGFDLCVLWQAVSLINLKMKRMLALEKRYLRCKSTWVISTCHGLLFFSRFSHFFAFLNGQTLFRRPFCFRLMTD